MGEIKIRMNCGHNYNAAIRLSNGKERYLSAIIEKWWLLYLCRQDFFLVVSLLSSLSYSPTRFAFTFLLSNACLRVCF